MNIDEMLNQLREILPVENFKTQPDSAHQELIDLEKTYRLNTLDFLNGKSNSMNFSEEIREKWINTLDIYIEFNGNINDLNHLPSSNDFVQNTPFLTEDNNCSKENIKKEYTEIKNKESNWIPCFLLNCCYNFLYS
ncbi:hypothetical protein PQ460_00310 [Paenibacillus sp. KACC 21273]|uniref:hypothetical protein n=1 Tax=Paenibacillus sp. KACC 21273 TaxID=3025665 RepID=UPI002366DB33|nr:hypothetical protein [Paenibacillus sp. KACC 21273]WDF50931.1 hypothetical protein PQ460_00310 [Paenibacillus sp. KACC 21273]